MKSLSKYIIVNKEAGDFLDDKRFETPKEKMAVIAGIHSLAKSGEVSFTEEDYGAILEAIVGGRYVVDTGRYFVNVGAPIGREEYLYIDSMETAEDGSNTISWGLDDLEFARPFTREEIASIVPLPYRGSDYIVMENVAKKNYRG